MSQKRLFLQSRQALPQTRERRRCELCFVVSTLVVVASLLFVVVTELGGPLPFQACEAEAGVESGVLAGSGDPSRFGASFSTALPDTGAWNLVLVNPWNPIPENYTIETVELRNGFEVDERCYPDLQVMMDDCRAEGLSPYICSAYRTQDVQERLYKAEMEQWLARGYSQSEAEMKAGTVVAVPGTSEHQLGLALDIVDIDYQILDESQEDTDVQKWLLEHSWEYGFILRYPTEKSHITGIIYEPWHYRYVGKEAAEVIHAQGLCLEEYLDRVSKA